jgi:hypothetical protein
MSFFHWLSPIFHLIRGKFSASTTPPWMEYPQGLILFGLISAGVYGVGWLLFQDSANEYSRGLREVFAWGSTFLLLVCYALGYQVLRKASNLPNTFGLKFPLILAFAGLFSLICIFIMPFHSTDIYGYINRGWEQVHYGLNPYVTTIQQIPGWNQDPMFSNHWVGNPSPYGFMFSRIAQFLCFLGHGDLHQTILWFKTFQVLIHLLIGVLVYKGAKTLNFPHPEGALFLYTWSPLILLNQIANGHNDILMSGFLMLGCYWIVSYQAWNAQSPPSHNTPPFFTQWILAACCVATLVKYAAGISLPFVFLYLWSQQRPQWVLANIGWAVVFTLVIGGPYWADWQSFQLDAIGTNATLSMNSLQSFVYDLLKYSLSPWMDDSRPIAEALSHGLNLLLWAGLFLYVLFRLKTYFNMNQKKEKIPEDILFQEILFLHLILVCVVSSKFYAWYLGMFFPILFYVKEGVVLRKLVLMLSCTLLLSFTFLGQAHLLNYWVMVLGPLAWAGTQKIKELKKL